MEQKTFREGAQLVDKLSVSTEAEG